MLQTKPEEHRLPEFKPNTGWMWTELNYKMVGVGEASGWGPPCLEAGSGIQELDSSGAEGTSELQQRQINRAKTTAAEASDGAGPHLSFYSQKEAEKEIKINSCPSLASWLISNAPDIRVERKSRCSWRCVCRWPPSAGEGEETGYDCKPQNTTPPTQRKPHQNSKTHTTKLTPQKTHSKDNSMNSFQMQWSS